MKKNIILLILFIINGLLFAADPIVENVRVEQRVDGSLLVDIYYDVTDSDGDTLTIAVNVSDDNGTSWMPCLSVSGDVGTNVISGTAKHIVWDFLTDNPNIRGDNFQVKVIAADKETLLDIDGNIYKTVQIGTQIWMAENLKVTHYRNGEPIPNVTDDVEWSRLATGGFCYYNNADSNAVDYGALYNWYAFDDERNIAPVGWHIPTEEEWKKMEVFLGMSLDEVEQSGWRGPGIGNKLKDNDMRYWNNENNGATNESGFSARPGGYRNGNNGSFHDMGDTVLLWSWEEYDNNNAWNRNLFFEDNEVYLGITQKRIGISVRLVCDIPAKVKITELNISPQDTLLNTGDTCQFTCIAKYTDGSVEDVTSFASWSILSGTSGSIDDTGLFKADDLSEGDIVVHADYQNITAVANLSVQFPPGMGSVTDIDGNVYKTVTIGDQVWMAENLKVTHYRNGDPIPNVSSNNQWPYLYIGALCYYNNDFSNAEGYGALYNWYAVVDARNIAPEGWHVPTNNEWETLVDFLGGKKIAGGKLKETGTKEAGTGFWQEPNASATNEFGFSARPGGYRLGSNGSFEQLECDGRYWTATEYYTNIAWFRFMTHDNADVYRSNYYTQGGFSVRLIKDN